VKFMTYSCIVLLTASALPALASPGSAGLPDRCGGDLHVVVTNLRSDNGVTRVYLADSPESYAFGGRPFRTADVRPQGRKAKLTFENIPCGDYAIRLFHDENADGRLDANFARIPTERYGFSNNARKRFGPADYAMARFHFGGDRMDMEIVAR
jgi:uncharacterized protein (DUF2141 family)